MRAVEYVTNSAGYAASDAGYVTDGAGYVDSGVGYTAGADTLPVVRCTFAD